MVIPGEETGALWKQSSSAASDTLPEENMPPVWKIFFKVWRWIYCAMTAYEICKNSHKVGSMGGWHGHVFGSLISWYTYSCPARLFTCFLSFWFPVLWTFSFLFSLVSSQQARFIWPHPGSVKGPCLMKPVGSCTSRRAPSRQWNLEESACARLPWDCLAATATLTIGLDVKKDQIVPLGGVWSCIAGSFTPLCNTCTPSHSFSTKQINKWREKEKGFLFLKKKRLITHSDNLLYWLDSLLDDSCKGYMNNYTSWYICQGCRDL